MSYKSSRFFPFIADPTFAALSRFRTVSRLRSKVMAIWVMFMYRIGISLTKKGSFRQRSALAGSAIRQGSGESADGA